MYTSSTLLQSRQEVTPDEIPAGFVVQNGRLIPYWYSREGLIIKWAVFLGMIVIFTAYTMIGYFHAKRRIRKGLVPLGYHRWLISRPELARVDPRYAYQQPALYQNYRPDYYGAQPGMPPPPPLYEASGRPPMYEGPNGATKVAPSQWPQPPPAAAQASAGRDEEYGVPSGPPPAQVGRNNTGSSNPYRP